jgi:hypothetical protein
MYAPRLLPPAIVLWLLCAAVIAAAQTFSATRPYAGVIIRTNDERNYLFDFWTGISLFTDEAAEYLDSSDWSNAATSPDGRFLADFGWTAAGQGVLHVLDASTQTVRCEYEPYPELITWASNSIDLIYLTMDHDLMRNLWMLDTAACTGRPLLETPFDTINGLRWSPDERRLALTAGDIMNQQMDLYVLDLDDGRLQALTRRLGRLDAPRWSPDGRAIGMIETARDPVTFYLGWQLRIVDLDGNLLHLLPLCGNCVTEWDWR